MLKDHLKTLTMYSGASSKQREKLYDEVTVIWRHLTNSHVIAENRHQNNVNTERLHQQRSVLTQFDGIKAIFYA